MCAGISPSRAGSGAVEGRADLGFARSDGKSRLIHLHQHEPLRVLFPTAAAGDAPLAALVTTSGGLVGGDSLDISVAVGTGAAATVTAQAAEKVYRSDGPDCTIRVELSVDDGGWLEWLPQETILFEGARLRRETIVDVTSTARLMAGEILIFGRTASGERLTRGLVRDAWEVRRGGRLVWADALHMDGDLAATLADPACFNGAVSCATLIYSGPDAGEWVGFARELIDEAEAPPGARNEWPRVAATCVCGLLLVRWVGRDAQKLRASYGRFWAAFRHRIGGLNRGLPRLWHV